MLNQEDFKNFIQSKYGDPAIMPDYRKEEVFLDLYEASMKLFELEFGIDIKVIKKLGNVKNK